MLSYFIIHEVIASDDRNRPWFNNEIENLIKNKTFFTNYTLLATEIFKKIISEKITK